MNFEALLQRLSAMPDSLGALLGSQEASSLRWRQDPTQWSLAEIVSHLLDEERFDFRPRLMSTLQDPSQPWTPIDPSAWVIERAYNDRDVSEVLQQFRAERQASVALLREWPEPDWSRAHDHPRAGPIRAGDLLVSWVAHDILHLRQILHRQLQWLQQLAADSADPAFDASYAGNW